MKLRLCLMILGLIKIDLTYSQNSSGHLGSKYINGFVVANNNDTIECVIKAMSSSSSCSFARIKVASSSKKTKYKPSDIRYYKRGQEEFYSIKRRSVFGGVESSFMKPVVKGYLTLYSYYFMRDNGQYSIEDHNYYLRKENGIALGIKRIEFSTKISEYLKDYPGLSEKIKTKELKYDDLRDIVKEYNDWYAASNIANSEKSRDTLNNLNRNDGSANRTVQEPLQLDLGEYKVKTGLDIPIFITRGYVHVPEYLRESIIAHSGGIGYDIGIGLKVDFSEYINVKLGFHSWNKIFNANYKALATDNLGNQLEIVIKENGSFNYLGIYIQMHYNISYFFIGGGFDISASEKYKCDYEIYTLSDELLQTKNNQSESPLIDRHNEQMDIVMTAGLRFKVKKKLIIKPAVEFTVPMQPVINTGVYYTSPLSGETNEVNISAFALKFGAVVEFDF